MKYLVVECHKSIVVLLDEKGRFFKAANMGYELGEIVTGPVLMDSENEGLEERYDKDVKNLSKNLKEKNVISIEERHKLKKKKKPNNLKKIFSLVAALILIVGFSVFLREDPLDPEVYISMEMRINPEIKIDINKDRKVIDLEGINPDGKDLLKDYKGIGKEKNTVLKEIIKLAEKKGYLKDGDEIEVTLDAKDKETFEKEGYEIRINIEELLKDKNYNLKIQSKNTFEEMKIEEEIEDEVEITQPVEEKPNPITPVEEDFDDDWDDDDYDDRDDEDDHDELDDDDNDHDDWDDDDDDHDDWDDDDDDHDDWDDDDDDYDDWVDDDDDYDELDDEDDD